MILSISCSSLKSNTMSGKNKTEMGKKLNGTGDLESRGLLMLIFRNRFPLITITIVALIVSVVVSLLITDRYLSRVILYPAVSTSLSRFIMGSAATSGDLTGFGQEEDAERLLQVLKSDAIREKIFTKYSLLEHYGIKENNRYPLTTLNKKFDSNVRFRKTEYMAIEIEVLDKDPVLAAEMANDIAGYIDSVMNDMLRERASQSLSIVQEEYRRLRNEVAMIEDSLRKIRELGVMDYESQAEVLNNAYATAMLNNDSAGITYFRNRLNTLSEWGGVYVNLRDNLVYQNEKLSDLKSVYDEVRLNASNTMPYKFIVTGARVAEKKTYPVRSLIVIVSTISAFLLALFTLVTLEALKTVFVSETHRKVKPKHGKSVKHLDTR
jgi:LPS O-antigen subunit length determinant protein (WzzB/FepE family)